MISSLLPLLLMACGDKSDTSDPVNNPSEPGDTDECQWDMCYEDCMEPTERTETFSIESTLFDTYTDDQGLLTEERCADLCEYQFNETQFQYVYEVLECQDDGADPISDGSMLLTCTALTTYYCEGRLHKGSSTAQCEDSLGGWCARAAHNETVSVASFLQLRAQLKQLGAPEELQQRCLLAARQEVAHARQMTHLARKHKGSLPELKLGNAQHNLLELAMENAVEGCIKETFAAMIALHQSKHAQTEELRSAMRRISADELEHAQLAADLDEWFLSQLSESERLQIAAAKEQALAELVQSWTDRQPHSTVEQQLGLPSQGNGLKLARAFEHALAA